MPARLARLLPAAVFAILSVATPALAQNYDLDARNVGMGAIGSTRNIADEHIGERRSYRRIGLPFGLLFQVLQNKDVFFYDSDRPRNFDFLRSLEYARNPFHFTLERDRSHTAKSLVDDIIDKQLTRDLRVYRPFAPAEKYLAEGVGAPNWGITLKSRKNKDKTLKPEERDRDGYQGVYVGAGPYLTVTTDTRVDQELSGLLGDPGAPLLPNTSMPIAHLTQGQAAIAAIVGYRLYIPHQTTGPRREGIYVYANYSTLFGLFLGRVDSTIRFDTDQTGLLALNPPAPVVDVNFVTARKGRGRVLDLGVAATIDRWDFGIGVNGIANRIDWEDFEAHRTQLANYFDGSEMEEVDPPVVIEPVRVKVPLNISTNLSYTADKWSVSTEYSRRFDGNNVQNGFEYRTTRLEYRAGLRYARDRWHPAGGIGWNVSDRIGVDAALLSTSTNVERIRTMAFVFSIRLNKKPKPGEQFGDYGVPGLTPPAAP
ncbi:MAG: hypothetical protein IT184_02580 [Acidobacteria bacterium]|nr:hypothetical protein [Acidobacteriota bacterium]